MTTNDDGDGTKYIDGDDDDDGGGMMEASLVDMDALAHDALKKSLSELATIHNQLIYRMQQHGHVDDIHGSDDNCMETQVGDGMMIKDAIDDDREEGDTERMNGLTTLLNTKDDCGDDDVSKHSFDSSHNGDNRQGHISINNLSADDIDDASIVADSFVSTAKAVKSIDTNLYPMYYPLLIDSNLIDEVDDDHANDSNRNHRSEGVSMIDNNISSDDNIIISSQEKDNRIEIYQVNNNNDNNYSNNDNNDKNDNDNNKCIINNNADNDENIHDDDHDDSSLYNDGSSNVPSRSVYLDHTYDGHHHHNELSDLINYDTTTANTSSIVDIDVYNNNINTNNILPLSIVNDSCHSITNDASKGHANIVDVSHSQDPISIDSLTTLLSFHDHDGDHGDNGIACDDSEVMKDHFIDMKNDGITSPLIALKTHIPPPLNIHSSSVSSSSSSSSMKEDDVSAQSKWMDDSPTTVKIKTIVGQEVGRLLGDDSRGSMNRHLHGHGIEDRDDDDGYDDHDVMRHENDQLTKGADDNHDVPSSTKQMTANKPIISFYVKDYSKNNTSTMIDRCMDTDETELSLYTSSSNWWNKIHPSSSSSSSSHHNHEEKPQQQQNKNNNNSSSSSNANDKYKIGHRHPSQYENNSNAKDNLTYKALDKSAIIHDRIRAISDWKYGGEASDSINNDNNNNSIAHLRLITNKYPGKQKRFIDSETDRISKIMMGVFQKPF